MRATAVLTSIAIVMSGAGAAHGATTVARTSTSAAEVVTIDVGGIPNDVLATPTGVWVSTGLGGIVRVDPRTDTPIARIRPGGSVTALARGLGAIWALDLFGDRLLRIDPRSNRVTRAIRVDGLPSGLALGHGLVWVASQLESTVAGINPRTGVVVKLARFARGELWPGGLAVGPDGVWVLTGAGNEVSLFDPATMTFRHRTRVVGARTIVAGGRSAWVGLSGGRSLTRIRGGRVLRTDAGVSADGYGPSLAAGNRIWASSGGAVSAIDRVSGAVVERLRLSRVSVTAIAASSGVWAIDADSRVLIRLIALDAPARSVSKGANDARTST